MGRVDRVVGSPWNKTCISCKQQHPGNSGTELTGKEGADLIGAWICGACLERMRGEQVIIRKGPSDGSEGYPGLK